MKKNSNNSLKTELFILILLIILSIGYAIISKDRLFIKKNILKTYEETNYNVHFDRSVPPSITKGLGDATIDKENDKVAYINVKGLSKKGDKAQAVYTIVNSSDRTSAKLNVKITNSNREYFKTTITLSSDDISPQERQLATITVELIKTPLESEISSITASISADPIENS